MTIFDEQITRKPNHYPWTDDFIKAIHEGFWTHREFTFSSDIHDYKVKLTEEERAILVKALSAIGQIEIAVKTFWTKLGDNLPHPSLYDMGVTFGSNEVVHNHAYEHLLTVLGLEEVFQHNLTLPCVRGRVNYLKKYNKKVYTDQRMQYLYAIILFTLFVENVSLFGQFYCVKWFGRFRNLLKDTNKQISYTLVEEDCISDDTEILTPQGWRLIKDMQVGDAVYQYHEDHTITQTKVRHTTCKPYNGEMYTFSRNTNICTVTPNHDMVYYNRKRKFLKRKAKDLKIHTSCRFPNRGVLINTKAKKDSLTPQERLNIALQADGFSTYVKSQNGTKYLRGIKSGYTHWRKIKKQRKIDNLRNILKKCNLKWRERTDRKRGGTEFKIVYNHKYDYKSFDWVNLEEVSANWCKEFIEEASKWDGYIEYGNNNYSSTNKECVDKIQTIGILAGYATNIMQQHESQRKSTYKDSYKVSFIEKDPITISHATKVKKEPYDGYVYCVSVDSGIIITRRKNKTFITGNCHAKAGTTIINTIRVEHPEMFTDDLYARVIEEAGEALKAETEIVKWMVGGFQDEYLNTPTLIEFVKNRLNKSLRGIGYEQPFSIDHSLLRKTFWFDEEALGYNMTDFFHSRPTAYSKQAQAIDEDSLF